MRISIFSDLLSLTGPVQERLQPGRPAAAVLQVSLQSSQVIWGEQICIKTRQEDVNSEKLLKHTKCSPCWLAVSNWCANQSGVVSVIKRELLCQIETLMSGLHKETEQRRSWPLQSDWWRSAVWRGVCIMNHQIKGCLQTAADEQDIKTEAKRKAENCLALHATRFDCLCNIKYIRKEFQFLVSHANSWKWDKTNS